MDLFKYGWIHLLATMAKEDSISHTSTQIWLDSLTSCKAKGNIVSRQSRMDLFRYGWAHLRATMAKEDSVSHQYTSTQIWLDSLTSCSRQYTSTQIWSDSLTSCKAKENIVSRQSNIDLFIYDWIYLQAAIIKVVSAVNRKWNYLDMVGFTYTLQ